MHNFNTQNSDNQEFLEFLNGEEFKVRFKKLDGLRLANIFKNAGLDKQSSSVYYCSQNLVLDSSNKIRSISSCRTRLCPICDWRRSIKLHTIISKVCNEICDFGNSDLQTLSYINFVFMTLTIENCTSPDLQKTIDLLLASWRRFTATKLYKNNILGSVRTIEITYNEHTKKYHPHLHILAHCHNYYFNKNNSNYIKHEVLKIYWKKALKADYEPFVHIQAFRSANVKELSKSIAEVAKYSVKSSDILKYCTSKQNESNILSTFFTSTSCRRLVSFQGELKKIKRLLKLDEELQDDISDTENDLEYLFRFNYLLKKYEFVEEIRHDE